MLEFFFKSFIGQVLMTSFFELKQIKLIFINKSNSTWLFIRIILKLISHLELIAIISEIMSGRILCQLKSDTGELLGAPIDLPLNVDKFGLEKLCQALLSSVKLNFVFFSSCMVLICILVFKSTTEEIEEDVPYSFFVDDHEILGTLEEVTNLEKEKNYEKITEIVYQPQALFK